MKKIALLLVLILSLLPFAACSQETPGQEGAQGEPFESQLLKQGALVVGTSPDYEPFEYIDESGNIVGFDIDMLNIIAEDMGLKLELKSMEFDTIITALQAGQIDLGVSGFTWSEDREGSVIFSTPYLPSAQMCVVLDESEFMQPTDLAGMTIYAGAATTGAQAAEETIENVTVITAGDYQIAFEYLKSGQVQGVVCDRAVAENYAALPEFRMLETELVNEDNYILLRNGNDDLAAAVNASIDKFKKSAEYSALLEQYELRAE